MSSGFPLLSFVNNGLIVEIMHLLNTHKLLSEVKMFRAQFFLSVDPIFINNIFIYSSCKRSVARRVRVLLTPETVDTVHAFISKYKHDISRKSAVQLLLFLL